MRRRNRQGLGDWGRVELSALNQSTIEMGIATSLIKASVNLTAISIGPVMIASQLQNAALWFRWRGINLFCRRLTAVVAGVIVVCHSKTIPADYFDRDSCSHIWLAHVQRRRCINAELSVLWFMTCIYHWNSVLLADLVCLLRIRRQKCLHLRLGCLVYLRGPSSANTNTLSCSICQYRHFPRF